MLNNLRKSFLQKFHGYDVFVETLGQRILKSSLNEVKVMLYENSLDVGPKNLKFEHHILSHLIETTRLPKTCSFSSLTT